MSTENTENAETKAEDFGMTSWDDEQPKPAQRKQFKKTRWDNLLKLKNGDNRIRFLTNPFYYYICEPLYSGLECTDPDGGACVAGDSGCTCETFEFTSCRTR